MMELLLSTIEHDSLSTQGALEIDGVFECYTLELPIKDGLPGSAIPPGRYPIRLYPSPKFLSSSDPWVQKYAAEMPHIDDIPNRSLIMFHWGNFAGDLPWTPEVEHSNTEGCVLVGKSRGRDFIGGSRVAFASLYQKIYTAAKNDDCFVTIVR